MAYVDGLLRVPLRMNVSKVLNLRCQGTTGILSVTDFHGCWRNEPALHSQWVEGLRPDGGASEIDVAVEVAGRLLGDLPKALDGPPVGR